MRGSGHLTSVRKELDAMYARWSALLLLLIALGVLAAPAQASFTGVERVSPFTG